MEKAAPDIKSLNSDVFKQIENTFKYTKPKERPQYLFNTEDFLPKLPELNLFFFDEITFQYPVDWDFEDLSEGQSKCYLGSNEQESQVITYSWVNGTITMTAEEWLKKSCDNLKSEYNNVQFFEKKATTYNTYNALTRKFKCIYEGETYYGQVVCIVQEESACAILKYAETEQELASDAFKLMESTFIMPILPPKRLSK